MQDYNHFLFTDLKDGVFKMRLGSLREGNRASILYYLSSCAEWRRRTPQSHLGGEDSNYAAYIKVASFSLVVCYPTCNVVIKPHTIHGNKGEHHSFWSLDVPLALLERHTCLKLYGNRIDSQASTRHQVLYTRSMALLPRHEWAS